MHEAPLEISEDRLSSHFLGLWHLFDFSNFVGMALKQFLVR